MIDYLLTSEMESFLYNPEKGLCQICLSLRLSVLVFPPISHGLMDT